MSIEERLGQLERLNKRQRIGLLVLTVALCAVVALGASSQNKATFDTVTTRILIIQNRAGENVAMLDGHGPSGSSLDPYGNLELRTMGEDGRLKKTVSIGFDTKRKTGYVELWDGAGNLNATLTE